MGGNLYQLKTSARPGEVMRVDGPYDTYGRVVALQASGFHLIRGLGHERPQGHIAPAQSQS